MSEKTGRKTFSSFRKFQNHLKSLFGLFPPELPLTHFIHKYTRKKVKTQII